MKINDNYEIRIVIANDLGDGVPGDIYDSYASYRADHPTAPYLFGYVVIDTRTGLIPDGCDDWNNTIQEAIHDWNSRKR